MAWIVTVTAKGQTADNISFTILFDNGLGTTFTKMYTTAETADPNWLKNQAKATLANVKAQATYANNINVNDTYIGIGN